MLDRTDLPLERQVAAALDWWRVAGVDLIFEDEPRNWLREGAGAVPSSGALNEAPVARPAPTRRAIPQPPRIGGEASGWPQDFAGFAEWWLAEPSLTPGSTGTRVGPRGHAGAELMVVVPMPEAEDRELLLSAREGTLVGNMLAATGLEDQTTYLAAALPCHIPEPDWRGLARDGLGAVLLHHLWLAKPKRLLVLGHGILPLLGHGSAQSPAAVTQTAIQSGETRDVVATLVGIAPGLLLDNGRQRAMLWRRWLDWTDADR